MSNYINKKILLPSKRYIDAEDVDILINIPTITQNKNINKEQINTTLSQEEQYEKEKEESNIYRLTGSINFLSPLVHKKQVIETVRDLFDNVTDSNRNVFTNMFRVYVCGFKEKKIVNEENQWFQDVYEVLTNTEDFEIYNAAYSKNIFGEQIYNFNVNIDFETTGTTLYYYFATSLEGEKIKGDEILGKIFDINGNPVSFGDFYIEERQATGTTGTTNYIEIRPTEEDPYDIENKPFSPFEGIYTLSNISGSTGEILTLYYDYKKFIPIKLKELNVNNNNFERLNFLFTNGTHYVYDNIVFSMTVNTLDETTKRLYSDFIINIEELLSVNNEQLTDGC